MHQSTLFMIIQVLLAIAEEPKDCKSDAIAHEWG